MGLAQRELIAQLAKLDTFLEFPPGAEGWALEDLHSFYDSCGELVPTGAAAEEQSADETQQQPLQQPVKPGQPELEPEPEPAVETGPVAVNLGGISLPVSSPKTPALVPWSGGWERGLQSSQASLSVLRWMMMQLALGQDMLLLTDPGPRPRRLVLWLCSLLGREVEYVGISRDTAECDLKQRREMIAGGSVTHEPAPPLRAAISGRVLILEGVEKAERNVLPLLNNLLENREMALDDGRFLVGPNSGSGDERHEATQTVPCSKDFVVVAIGLPQPTYTGNPLDPPLRSRFACHRLAPEHAAIACDWEPDHNAGHDDRRRSLLILACDTLRARSVAGTCAHASGERNGGDTSNSRRSVGHAGQLPWISEAAMSAAGKLLRILPHLSVLTAVRCAFPFDSLGPVGADIQALAAQLRTLLAESDAAAAGYCVVCDAASSEDGRYGTVGLEPLRQQVNAAADATLQTVAVNRGHSRDGAAQTGTTTPRLVESQAAALGLMVASHAAGMDFCLLGNRAGGKTFLVRRFAQLLDYTIHTMFLHPEMSATELLQRRTTSPAGATVWHDSPLVSAAYRGDIGVLDGAHRLAPGVLAAALAPLIHERCLWLPDGSRLVSDSQWQALQAAGQSTAGLRRVHPSFRIVVCAEQPTSRRQCWLSDEVLALFGCFVRLPAMTPTEQQSLLSLTSADAHNTPPAMTALMSYDAAVRAAADKELVLTVAQMSIRQLIRASQQLAAHPDEGTSLLRRTTAPAMLAMPVAARAIAQQLLRTSALAAGIENAAELQPESTIGTGGTTAASASGHGTDRMTQVLQAQAIQLRTAEMWGMRDGKLESALDSGIGRLVERRRASRAARLSSATEQADQATQQVAADSAVMDIRVSNGTLRIKDISTAVRVGSQSHLVPCPSFVAIGGHVDLLRDMLSDWCLDQHLLLLGRQGVGKNKLTDKLLQLLQAEREYVQLHRDSTVASLTTQPTLVRGVIHHEDSALVRAVRFGRVLVVDEADKAPLEVVCVLKALVEDGELALGDGRRLVRDAHHTDDCENDDEVIIHPGFRMVVLANPPGWCD